MWVNLRLQTSMCKSQHGPYGDVKLRLHVGYLESVSAADVVIGLHLCDDITGQGDAAQYRLLSAV